MNLLKALLHNRFSGGSFEECYVDRASHLGLTFGRDVMGVEEICPRGLINLREALTSPGLRFLIQWDGLSAPVPVTGVSLATDAGGVSVSGGAAVGDCAVRIDFSVTAQEFNCYRMRFEMASVGAAEVSALRVFGAGRWKKAFSRLDFSELADGSVAFAAAQSDPKAERLSGIREDWCAAWRWAGAAKLVLRRPPEGMMWLLELGEAGSDAPLEFILEMENRPWEKRFAWNSRVDFSRTFPDLRREAEERVLRLMERLPGRERAGFQRELRAAMILDRCSYQGGKYGMWRNRTASFCMPAGWASTAFFWDSVFGALGLSEFSQEQAEEAIAALFPFQRADGNVPTHSYEYAPGSTFLPQAPILGWGVSQLYERFDDLGFVRRMLPHIRGVFDWYTLTQDHDRDGLAEFRFSGQIADDAPQYDNYVAHVQGSLKCWNIFLPPVASVALNSFLYAEAHFLARLYRLTGNESEACEVEARVAKYPRLLMDICYDPETAYFHDFDHNPRQFNRCRVLTSLLPVWAGMPLPSDIRKTLIEENLLNPERFGGPLPCPYVSRDDPAYDPRGYWRGRIWPHLAPWMLELLWQNGYERAADGMADDLLMHVLDREEVIRENYYSGAEVGGGSPDYQWTGAVYLFLANRRYRNSPLK